MITDCGNWPVNLNELNTISGLRNAVEYLYCEGKGHAKIGSNVRFRNVTVTSLTIAGMTAGSVLFIDAAGAIAEDNPNFFWDDGANRLGLGTNTPVSLAELYSASANPVLTITAAHATNYDPQVAYRRGAAPAVEWTHGINSGETNAPWKLCGGVDLDQPFFLRFDTTLNNIQVGYNAGLAHTGTNSIAIGYESLGAGGAGTTGISNVAIGYRAGYVITTGNANMLAGYLAGSSIVDGFQNVAFGANALENNVSGNHNVAIGASALLNVTAGTNIGFGTEAGVALTSATGSVAIGYRALYNNQTGTDNIAIGAQSLFGVAANNCTLNVGVGYKTLYNITTGSGNTAIGYQAMVRITDSTYNIGIGYNAGDGITTGDSNVAIGEWAMRRNSTGNNNVAIGKFSDGYNAGSTQNHTGCVAIGAYSLYTNRTANYNVAIGYNAFKLRTSGDSNVAVGRTAGYDNITGERNIFLGDNAGRHETGSDKLYIDNRNRTNLATVRVSALMYGTFNATPASQVLRVNGTLEQIGGASSIRFATDMILDYDVLNGAVSDFRVQQNGTDRAAVMNDGTVRLGDTSANYSQFATDGEQTMVGTARVYKIVWISASAARAAGAKPATIGLNGGGYVVASFADNQEQQIQYNFPIPEDMDRSADCELRVGWSSPTISQDCDWEITWLATAVDDDTEAAGTTDTGFYESSGTADGLVVSSLETIAGGTLGASDVCLHIVLERDGNDAGDTLGDVAEVHGVCMRYVSNKHGTAL